MSLGAKARRILLKQIASKILPALKEKIKADLLQMARDRVPRDTGELEDNIKIEMVETADQVVFTISVLKTPRNDSNLTNFALGIILELGGKNGTALRSQSKPKNPAGTPVSDWWGQFQQDVGLYITNFNIPK